MTDLQFNGGNFEKCPREVPCFVGVAWNFSHPKSNTLNENNRESSRCRPFEAEHSYMYYTRWAPGFDRILFCSCILVRFAGVIMFYVYVEFVCPLFLIFDSAPISPPLQVVLFVAKFLTTDQKSDNLDENRIFIFLLYSMYFQNSYLFLVRSKPNLVFLFLKVR